MMKYQFFMLVCTLLLINYSWGQTIVEPFRTPQQTSFAIFTDEVTWEKCQPEIQKYKEVLEKEDLPTYIVVNRWENPEQVRDILFRLYRENNLEGTVFVGDIPIPMIRKAQHMTSAFKMDEEKFPMRESSVPSDRFYDDFDLKFDFLTQDSTNRLFFYYNLAAESPQMIRCDIYSGRIKPILDGSDRYQQISDYLKKVVATHEENNPLDQFVSYTGEGSYSNSLTAWQMEQMILREQLPGIFERWNNARFMRYNMWQYPKSEVITTLQREDLDMMIFHEHGMPDRQYISAIPATYEFDQYVEFLTRELRSKIRRTMEQNEDYQRQIAKWSEELQLDSSWFAGVTDPKSVLEDSLVDVRMGIVLEDIPEIAPNARFVIFDACYNGDFREDDYIAGRYIFSKGKCVVAFANSVNVLQDKSANDLFGLLGCGARIGLWARYTNILESHILGDPTFCFRPAEEKMACNEWLAGTRKTGFWLEMLQHSPYADLQNMALIKLVHQEYPGISDTLRIHFETSPYAVVRYNCMTLLEQINDRNFREVLKRAVTDPYEFIRRIAVHRMGRIGATEFLPYIIDAYLNDYLSARVNFNVGMALQLYRWKEVEAVLEKELAAASALDKEQIRKVLGQRLADEQLQRYTEELIKPEIEERAKLINIRYLKNANYHPGVDTFVALLKDTSVSLPIRKGLAESLAWFSLSEQKEKIIAACREILQTSDATPEFRQELLRTYHRLQGDIENGAETMF